MGLPDFCKTMFLWVGCNHAGTNGENISDKYGVLERFIQFAPVHPNMVPEFHKLAEPVVNNISLLISAYIR